jgi:hypothetical protein
MNVSARDVGACVSELFREDRINTNQVIEAHVARARGGAVREKLPIIDVASRSVGSPTPSGERAIPRPRTDAELSTSPDSPNARSIDVPATLPPVESRKLAPGLRPVLVTGAAGVLVAIAVIFLIARTTHDSSTVTRAEPAPLVTQPTPKAPAPTPEPAPAPAPVTPPPRPRSTSIDVEIRVSPGTATVSIDGKVVDGNPFIKQYPSDDSTHYIRAIAPGYVAKDASVAFNANVTLDWSLERVLPPPPPPPPAPAPTPAPAPPQRTSPARPRPPEPRRPEPQRPVESTPHVAEPAPTPRAPEVPAPRPIDTTPPTEPTRSGTPAEVDPAGGSKPHHQIDRSNPYDRTNPRGDKP